LLQDSAETITFVMLAARHGNYMIKRMHEKRTGAVVFQVCLMSKVNHEYQAAVSAAHSRVCTRPGSGHLLGRSVLDRADMTSRPVIVINARRILFEKKSKK